MKLAKKTPSHIMIRLTKSFLMVSTSLQISIDFAVYNNQHILVVKDRVSGLIWGKVTKNHTSDKAFKRVMEWSYRVGIPM